VNLIGVVGEQSKPNVIRFGHRPSQAAAINVADFEVLKETTLPARLNRHDDPPL
jgi:hypothetical protein